MLIQLSNNVVINPDNIVIVPSDGDHYEILTSEMREITVIDKDECQVLLRLSNTMNVVNRTCEWNVLDGTLHRRHAMLLAGRYFGVDLSGDFGHMLECLKGDVARATQENCPGSVRSKILSDVADLRGDQEFDRFTDDGREVLGDILQDGALSLSMRQKAMLILDKWNEIFDDLPF